MINGRLSWEPDWDRPLSGDYLRRLVDALHDVLMRRHFARRTVHGLQPAGIGDGTQPTVLGEPDDPLDDIATWTRYTEAGYVENMMNGVACFGNGLIRVALDRGHGIQLLAQETSSPDTVAFCVAGFIDRTDDLCRTQVLRETSTARRSGATPTASIGQLGDQRSGGT